MKIIPYDKPNYTAANLWQKISTAASRLGRETVEKILWLYYASRRPQTPKWAKTLIYSTLAYFILPVDAIPDFIPISGYTDDVTAIAAALATLAAYVDDDVKRRTTTKLKLWFGDEDNVEIAKQAPSSPSD